jgi:hypothetical protein
LKSLCGTSISGTSVRNADVAVCVWTLSGLGADTVMVCAKRIHRESKFEHATTVSITRSRDCCANPTRDA